MAQDLNLSLKIKTLVEGLKQVEALANEVRTLGTEARKPIPDNAAKFRAGVDGARAATRGLVTEIGAIKGDTLRAAVQQFAELKRNVAGQEAALKSAREEATRLAGQLKASGSADPKLARSFDEARAKAAALKTEVAAGRESLELMRRALGDAGVNTGRLSESMRAVAKEAAAAQAQTQKLAAAAQTQGERLATIARQSQRVTQARSVLGIDRDTTERDIRAVQAALQRLKDSGTASMQEIARASIAAKARITELRAAAQAAAGGGEQAQRLAALARQSQRVTQARSVLGIDRDTTERDIRAVQAALQRLKDSGTASMQEIARASRAAKARISELREEASKAKFGRFYAGMDRARIAARGLASELVGLKGAAAALGVGLGTREIVQAGIAFDRIERSLLATTGSAESAGREYAFVRGEVERLGLNLEITASEFAKLAAASKGTALEGQATRDIFTAVAEASTVLGLSADKTSGALLAIQQMISKGTVSAEELRGQLGERLPGAFQIAARSLGVTTQELGKMLELGQITAEQLLPRMAVELRKTFGHGLEDAVKSSQAQLNRFMTTIFELKVEFARSGFLDALTDSLNQLRGTLSDPEFRRGLRDFGAFVGDTIRYLVENRDAIIAVGAALAVAKLATFSAGMVGARGKTQAYIGAITALTAGLGTYVALQVSATDETEKQTAATAKQTDAAAALNAEIERLEEALQRLRNPGKETGASGFIARSKQETEKLIADIEARLAMLRAQRDAASPASPKLPPFERPTKRTDTAAAQLALTRATIEAQAKLIADGIAREELLLDRQKEDNLISLRDYYAQRGALQVQAANAEIARVTDEIAAQRQILRELEQSSANSRPEDQEQDRLQALAKVKTLTAELTVLELKRGDIAGEAARAQAQAEQELAAQLDRVQIALLQAQGRDADARTLEMSQQYGELIKRLQVEGNAAGEALVRKLINVEAARAQLDQLRAEYSRALAAMQLEEQRIGHDRDAGLKSEMQARREIVELHKRTSQELSVLVPQMEALGESIGPDAAADVARIGEEVRSLGLVVDETAAQMNSALQSGLSQFFDDIMSGTQKGKNAFEAFGDSVVATLRRIIAEKAAMQLIDATVGSSFGQAIAGIFHTGGIVGAGAPTRTVSPLAFVGAPRYHSGGVLGLKPDEVPAILQLGEEVLTRNDPRHRNNGGSGGNVTVQMNISTPDADSFRRSQGRIARDMADAARRAQERHG